MIFYKTDFHSCLKNKKLISVKTSLERKRFASFTTEQILPMQIGGILIWEVTITMRKSAFGKQKSLGKGFYIALAISVVAVGTVAYLTISRLNSSLNQEPNPQTQLQNGTDWSVPELEDVGKNQSGVPLESSAPEESSGNSANESAATMEQSSSSEESTSPATNTNGAYIMPLSGEIMNPYSNGELVKSKTLGEWRTHDGVDIKAAEGTPVKSCFDGTVTNVTNDGKWGIMVEIEYPACTTYFCGLADTVKVKKGQEVKLGDVIGEVGNSSLVENADEFHLHLAMKKDNQWIDPMTIITQN